MEQRNKSFIILCLINFAGNSGYAVVLPLFPPLAALKGIDEAMIGYIICLYPVGAFIVALILGQTMSNQTIKKLMELGLYLTTAGMLGIALVENIDDKLYFILASGFLRLMTGIVLIMNIFKGATLCFTPSYSLTAYLFPDQLSKVMSQMEIVTGLALFSGPLVGGLFYIVGEKTFIGGYQLPYYVLCSIYIMIIPLLKNVLIVEREDKQIVIVHEIGNQGNHSLNNIDDYPEIEIHSSRVEEQVSMKLTISSISRLNKDAVCSRNSGKSVFSAVIQKLSYYHILKIQGIIISYLAFVLFFVSSMALRTYFAIYLQKVYLLTPAQSTLVFVCDTVTFGISATFVGHYENLDRKVTYAFGLLISSFAYFLYGFNEILYFILGPDPYFTGLPHELWIVILADGIFGLGMGAICALIVAEYVSIIKESYPNNDDDINDIAAALYISGWSFGEFAGPLVGSLMVPNFGYERTGSIMGFCMFGIFLIYSGYVVMLKRRQIRRGVFKLLI